MKRFIYHLLFFVFLLISNVSTYAEDESFKIGMVVCLSGDCAADGTSALRGAELAVEELNAGGGVLKRTVQLVIEDTAEAFSGAKAVTAFKTLRLDKEIHYLIGPSWTPAGLALAPLIAKDSDILMTSPSLGVKDFNQAGSNIFNARGADEIATRKLAHYAYAQGWKRIAIMSSQQPWELAQGNFFEEEFRKSGGEVVVKVEPLPSSKDLQTDCIKVLSAKPDAIFFSQVIQLALTNKRLMSMGYEGPKLAAYVDETRLEESNGALEGIFFSALAESSASFIEKYKSKYQSTVELPASVAYDTVMIYAKAINEAQSFVTAIVKEKMLSIKYQGASGAIAFDSEGGAIREAKLLQLVGGEYQTVPEKRN